MKLNSHSKLGFAVGFGLAVASSTAHAATLSAGGVLPSIRSAMGINVSGSFARDTSLVFYPPKSPLAVATYPVARYRLFLCATSSDETCLEMADSGTRTAVVSGSPDSQYGFRADVAGLIPNSRYEFVLCAFASGDGSASCTSRFTGFTKASVTPTPSPSPTPTPTPTPSPSPSVTPSPSPTPSSPYKSAGCGAPLNYNGSSATVGGITCTHVNSTYSNQNLYRCFTTSSGMSREFDIAIPISYDANTAYSLLFGWHGSTWTSSNFARAGGSAPYFPIESYANPGSAHHEAIVIYPQGLSTRPSGFVQLLSGTGWDLRVNGYDVILFDDILKLINQSMCVDSRHVFTFGQSYGGWFNQVLACARPNVLRAAATSEAGSVAGYVGSQCAAKIPHFQSHNLGDPTVSYSQGVSARTFWMDASRNGCDTSVYVSGQPAAACRRYTSCKVPESVWCEASVNTHSPYYVSPTNNVGVAAWGFFKELMSGDL